MDSGNSEDEFQKFLQEQAKNNPPELPDWTPPPVPTVSREHNERVTKRKQAQYATAMFLLSYIGYRVIRALLRDNM